MELLHALALDARRQGARRCRTIAPDVAGFVTDLRVRDNQAVHKGDILFVVDQERYKLAVASAEANVAARHAEMLMRQSDADRRIELTNLAISDEAKEDSEHVAASALAAYQQAAADLSTAKLNLERTVVRAPVNGFVTNLGLVVGQYAALGTQLLALIDSDSYRVEGYFEETKMPNLKPGARVEIHLMSGDPRCMATSKASAAASPIGTTRTGRNFWRTSIRRSSGSGSPSGFHAHPNRRGTRRSTRQLRHDLYRRRDGAKREWWIASAVKDRFGR